MSGFGVAVGIGKSPKTCDETRVLLYITNDTRVEVQPMTPALARLIAAQLMATATLIEEQSQSPPPDQPDDEIKQSYQTNKVI
jgi:hypothetical protein